MKTYDQFRVEYGENYRIPYLRLLETIEWRNKQNPILQ